MEPNYTDGFVDRVDPDRLAIIEVTRAGERFDWTFGDVSRRSTWRAMELVEMGVGRGSVVLTMIGNRPDWVLTMLACFRLGAVVLPCNEQLRPKDIAIRLETTDPAAIVADERNLPVLGQAAPRCPVLPVGGGPAAQPAGPPPEPAMMAADDPALITFTSGSTGQPKAVLHAHRYLGGQRLQGLNWLGGGDGDIVWCTASTGWSKSARNAFIAPWLSGSAAVLHDGRFDPVERLELVQRLGVSVLCMSPTEYRMIAKQGALREISGLRRAVAAGEALDADTQEAWRGAIGIQVVDGYGQTETGQMTGTLVGEEAPLGSMGRPLPGIEMWIDEGELVVDPRTVPTFFLGYMGEEPHDLDRPWRTGDEVEEDDDGFLRFVGRADDVIVSSGYRIGPFEVESALVEHTAVADAAVVAAPDAERGSVVKAVVVLGDEYQPSPELAKQLQAHVREVTAPYKYPRIVEFVDRLPRTATGKVKRSALRARP